MREKLVKRFWCDHCNRAGLSKFHMRKHECGCTKNPERICRMHAHVAELEPTPSIADLISAIERGGLKELRAVANECPMCILAGIVQFPWPPYPDWEYDRDGNCTNDNIIRHPFWEECHAFDFKKERDAFWAEEAANQQQMRDEYYGNCIGFYS